MGKLQQAQNSRFSTIRLLVEQQYFNIFITTLIILNAVILGMETYPNIMASYGSMLKSIDHIILWIFVAELTLRFLAYPKTFFFNPWSIFDVIVISVAFMPSTGAFSILRAARVLRALRLVSMFPKLKRVVEGLIRAIPGIGSIVAVLVIIMYVFGVMATKLYGQTYPEWFGRLPSSIFSLFQIMTLEGWPDIVRTVMKMHPHAWLFFVTYIVIATFSVLNLFIAVIVDAMQKQHTTQEEQNDHTLQRIESALDHISLKIEELKKIR